MRISPEVEIAVSLATREALRRLHEYVTVDHLVYALLFDAGVMGILSHVGGDPEKLRPLIEAQLDADAASLPDDDTTAPGLSLGFQRVLSRAVAHVQSSGEDEVTGANVLVAVFSERDSVAATLLESHGVTRFDVVNYLSHGISKRDGGALTGPIETGGESAGGGDGEEDAPSADPLASFTSNLNERAAEGEIDPLIGRMKEIDRVIQVLCRRRKNNPMLVGDAGVGKTAIAEGLAKKINDGEVPELVKDCVIYSLDMGSLLAGTRFRGDFENRLKAVVHALEEIPGSILFIDEIHNIMGAGAAGGSTMDASNLLKPALMSGKLRCMGSTTYQEYRNHVERDRALVRRFQKVEVSEPSEDDSVKILQGLQERYESFHKVSYSDEAIIAAVALSTRYLQDRKLPDKAIDLIDEAGSRAKLDHGEDYKIGETDIETIVAKMAQIPPKQVSTGDRDKLAQMESDLKKVIYAQDDAIEQLSSAIKLSRAGLRDPEKPIGSFLFTGPTGVGKTELAKQLARILGIEFIRFDMSEYQEKHSVSRLIGAPPGYVGFDQGGQLTEAINKTPHAVLLLDEVEKAHPDVFSVLLQVMDHGTLTDNNGRPTDFRHTVLIMTSNVGTHEMQQARVGFGSTEGGGGDAGRAYKNMFSPEFRNRLDARIHFGSLDPKVMERIVDKFMLELADQLAEREILIDVLPDARKYLAEAGYDKLMGARPLARVIDTEIKRKLSDEILFGKLEHGGTVTVSLVEGALHFGYAEPSKGPGKLLGDGGAADRKQITGDAPSEGGAPSEAPTETETDADAET
jgi:ATP-dependent Clp protease ATP-binding subunit ClpA